MDRNKLERHILDYYGDRPEYLWEAYPDTCVYRHCENRKWYAVVMEVQRHKLGLDGDGAVEVLDVKCGPLLGGSYRGRPGILPAWHMNKAQWLSVLLDGSCDDGTIEELLSISYDLTGKKKR